MATFVLVHGAWLGGWVWRDVAAALRAAGHTVLTPTLTGLGERAHLGGPQVGLQTHIADVVNVLEYEDLAGVTLVGHSYGGMVVTGVADHAAHRLSQLIYLDAFVPEHGQSLHDLVPPQGGQHNRDLAAREGDGWRIPLERQWRTGPAERLPWLEPRWTDQPLRCFEERLPLARPSGAGLPRTYIRCTQNLVTGMLFARFAADPAWRVCELPAEHAAMVSAPDALAALLDSLAEPSR